MADLASMVRAGAIVPSTTTTPDSELTATVSARSYAHPALPGRPLVRLVADPLAAGVDAEMELLGFNAPDVRGGLGQQRYRALGFPGWALVHDPARARFALDVMRDFKGAAARVKSKPGHARDAFIAIGDRLGAAVPHFLPSFWEEAGRVFLAEDATSFAAQCFEKARTAEKAHALAIDEDLRSAVYLEFALAGAIPSKSFAGYAAELERTYGATAAYARFRELAVRRTLGGLAPWVGMAKDLRRLAKAGGLDVEAEDAGVVEALLDAPSIGRAPGDFWSSYRVAIVAMARGDAKARRRIRHLFPRPSAGGHGFETQWLGLLDEARAFAALEHSCDEEPKGATAAYVSRLIDYLQGNRALLPYLDRLASRMREDGVPVVLGRSQHWRNLLDLHIVERALELGVPVADPHVSSEALSRASVFGHAAPIARFPLDGPLVDPVRVAADPRFLPCLVESVADVVGTPTFETNAAGKAGFTIARKAWLEGRVRELETSALHGFTASLAVLHARSGPALLAEYPDVDRRLREVTVAGALATTLRGGLLAELTWPAFESAEKDLGSCLVGGAFPFVVLYDLTKRAIVLNGDERVLDHSYALPKKATVHFVVFVDGQLLVVWWDPTGGRQRGYWSNNPAATFEITRIPWHHGRDLMMQAAVPSGGVTLGARVARAGDTGVDAGGRVVHDGTTYWTMEWHGHRQRLVELDPRTGAHARASWPSFARDASERDDGKHISEMFLLPAPPGTEGTPLGIRDGLIGHVVRTDGRTHEVTGIDGRTRTAAYAMHALVTFPGDDRPRSAATATGIELRDPDGALLAVLGGSRWSHPFGTVPPLSCWHYLRSRDPAGSAALRRVDRGLADRLLAGNAVDTVAAELPAITDVALREAVCLQVNRAKELVLDLAKIVNARAPASTSARHDTAVIPSGEVISALGPLAGGYGHGHINTEIRAAARALTFEDPGPIEPTNVVWESFLGHLRGVAVYSLSASLGPASRRLVKAFLRALRAEPSLTEQVHDLRMFRAKVTWESPLHQSSGCLGRVESRNAYFVRKLDDGVRHVVERTRDGTFRLPAHTELMVEVRPSDDAAFLDAFLTREDVPPVDDTSIDLVAERTGLTRAEAAILLVGVPRLSVWESDALGKELRARLGLKLADARVAMKSLIEACATRWKHVFAEAGRVDDPSVLFDSPGFAERVAEGWNAVVGRRQSLREDLVIACEKELAPPSRTTDLLGALLDPSSSPLLAIRESRWDELFAWQSPADRLSAASLASFALLLPWLFSSLPVGDPYRDAIPRLHEVLLARLADASVLLPLAIVTPYGDTKAAVRNREIAAAFVGDERPIVVDGVGTELVAKDGGGLVILLNHGGQYLNVAFRPAKVDVDDELAWSVSTLGYAAVPALGALRLLRSRGFAALIERVRSTPVPVGRFEADPRASCPEHVSTVRRTHGLSEDAATLYLQTLALAEPTQRNVLRWNDWTPKLYKQAVAALLGAGLVVAGKRERAGRECFLPGAWDKGRGKALPMERWKQPLYALDRGTLPRLIALRPLHEIFGVALDRVARGDVPKLEEV